MLDQGLTFDYRDEFGRREIAEKIKSLLEGNIDISPMLLDGGWGAGKSEFCQKLVNLINSEDVPALKAIYIDAFEADHADEPLLTILSSILNVIEDQGDKKRLKEKSLPVLRYVLGAALKVGTSTLLSKAGIDADAVVDEIQNASNDLIDKSVNRLLKDHEKVEESLNALKALLTTVGDEQPLVIFVDELDRCRPDYTVTMLENIKHIFDVDNIQFVLVANSKQITSSVKHRYGINDDDAEKYLDKFIRLVIQLPDILVEQDGKSGRVSEYHYENLVAGNLEFDETSICSPHGLHFVKKLIQINNLSLRDVENLCRHLTVAHTLDNNLFQNTQSIGADLLIVYGVFLFCFYPNIAQLFISDDKASGDMIGPLTKLSKFGEFGNEYPEHNDILAFSILDTLSEDGVLVVNLEQEFIEQWRDLLNNYFGMHIRHRLVCILAYPERSIRILKLS